MAKKNNAVSARAFRNEKAKRANADKEKKVTIKKSEEKSTTSDRGSAVSNKKRDYSTDLSPTAKRAGVTQEEYKKTSEKTQNRKKVVTSTLQQVIGGHAKTLAAIMPQDDKSDYEGQAKGKYGAIVSKPSYESQKPFINASNKLSDWGSKQIEKGSKKYEEATKDMSKLGKFGADVASAGIGLAADYATGPLAPVSMFSRAMGSAYHEAEKEGATHEQAMLKGVSTGSVEAITEKMFAVAKPLQKIYGKGVADDLTEKVLEKVVGKNAGTKKGDLLYHGGKTLASAITEGLEEMIAEGLDPVIANSIYAEALGKPHSTSAGEILYSGLVGGALGGILGVSGQVVEYSKGKGVQNVLGEDGMKNAAKVASEVDDAADAVRGEALDKMMSEGGGLAPGQALQIQQAVDKQNAKDIGRMRDFASATKKLSRENGLVDIVREVDENGTLDLADNAREVYEGAKAKALDITKADEKNQLPDETADEISSDVAAIVTGAVTDIDTVNRFTLSNTLARKIYEQTTGETLPTTNAETRDYLYQQIAKNRQSMMEAETELLMDKIKGVVQQDVGSTFGGNGQTAFSKVMENANVRNGRDVNDTIVAFENYYEAGRTGMTLEEMADIKNPAYDILTAEQKTAAYNAGVNDAVKARESASGLAEGIKLTLGQKVDKNDSRVKSGASRGKLVYEFENVDNKSRFTASQQTFYQALAEKFNLNIHITDNQDYNGMYVDGELWMAVFADRDLSYVFSHEITHHMQQYAPEEYEDYKDMIRTAMGPEAVAEAIRAKINHYAKHGKKLTREAAFDEIVADATYEMIQDDKFVNELVKEDRTLAQKILDSLRSLIKKIRAMLAGEKKFTPAQNEALLSQLDILKDAERLWEIGLKKAVENRDAVGLVENDGKVQHSIYEDFETQLESWDGETIGFAFTLGETSDVLQQIGVKKRKIKMDASKIKSTIADHGDHGMSKEIIKKIPDVLEDPVVVMQSKSVDSRLVLLGELRDENGKQVTVVMELLPVSKKGRKRGKNLFLDVNMIVSSQGRRNVQGLLDSSPILYINPNKKKTDNWLNVNRVQFPLRNQRYGLIKKVSYTGDSVKLVDVEAEKNVQFSLKGENAVLSEEEKSNLQTAKNMQRDGKSKQEIWDVTGWYTQSDGKWRIEMPDEIMGVENFSVTGLQPAKDARADKFRARANEDLKDEMVSEEIYNQLIAFAENVRSQDFESGKLPEFLNAPKLYEAYPQLKDTSLSIRKITELGDVNGYTDVGLNKIVLDPERLREAGQTVREGLAHEIQHLIQSIEGFMPGANPKSAGGFDAYWNAGGEIEARDVESRLKMSSEERRNRMPAQFSLKDNKGRDISEGQAKFFEESKVRDADDNIKTMYHGSPESFEAFDKKKAKSSGYYGRGFYFTDSESHASQYGNLYEVYLDIRNPIQEDSYNITREQFTNFVEAVAADEDYGIDNYGYDATVDSVVESVYGKDDFAMLMDIDASCIGDMVAAVKLFNEVNGTNYDGIFAPTETVAFYPEQVKDVNNTNPTADPRMKFSLKDSVEDTRDLIAVHNIASSELLKTLALGGFPMPSIAVVKDTQSHEKYGDVSVLFGKETIDPKTSKANKVYGGDAWTPVFPSIDYKVDRDASEEIEKRVEDIIGRELMRLMRTPLDYDNVSDALNRWSGNISDAYGNSDGLRYAFLKEKGVDIDVPTKEARLGRRDNGFYIALAEKLGEEKLQKIHMDCSGEYRNGESVSAVVDVFNEYVAEKYKAKPKLVKSLSIEKDDIGFADFDEMTRGAYKYLNGGVKTEPDVYALSKSVDEYFEENNVEAEYEGWLGNLFSDIIESEGIRNDKDIFTPSGNRRSWESLHMAVTLENVVKAMKKQAEKGAGIAGFGSPFGAAQRNFKSVDDIRANKDRLQRYNEEEYEEIHSEISDRFTEIAGRFAKKEEFGSTIDAGTALIESIAKSNSKAQLDRYLKADGQWFNYSEGITEDLWELVEDIQSMPTEYFEAKPQRAVGFDEVVSVIVPDNASDELFAALEENDIEYAMYEAGNEQNRTDVVNAQAVQNDVKFSLKDDTNISEDDVNEYVNAHPEEFMDIMQYFYEQQEAHRTKQQTVGELKSQLEKMKADKKLTHGKVLDVKSIEEDANSLVRMLLSYREDNTKLTDRNLVKLIQENAKQIYTQLQNGNNEDATLTAYYAAEELVHNLNMVNDEMFEQYKELREYLRTTRVYIPNEYLGDFTDLAEFRKQNMGRIRLVNEGNGGVSVDSMYEELKGMFPGMFDETLDNPADQMYEISNVREQLDPYEIVLSHEETEQLIKEAAHDIIELAVNGKPWQSWADRKKEVYDERVRALKQKHQEALRDVKNKEKDRYKAKLDAQKAKANDKVKEAKAEGKRMAKEARQEERWIANERVFASEMRAAQERERLVRRYENQKDARKKTAIIRKMEKNIQWLSDRLLKPTDDKHLPEGYQKAVAQLLYSIDTQTARSKKLEEKYGLSKKRLKFLDLKNQYEKIAEQEGSDILVDEEILDDMDKLSEMLEGQTIAEASLADLEKIYKVLKNIKHGISMVNQAFVESQKETVSGMAEATIANANTKKPHVDRSGMLGGLDTLLNESMVTPRDFFERIGGGLNDTFMGIRKGLDRHVDNMTTVRDFFSELFTPYNNVSRFRKRNKPGSEIETWRNSKTKQEFELESGSVVNLTVAQRMSLYCLWKREQARGHIAGSGIVVTDISAKRKIVEAVGAKKEASNITAKVTYNDVENIIGSLSQEQIEMADAMQAFLNNECAAWGNETSMRLYGYNKFTEPNYFPIKSAKGYLDTKFDGAMSIERIRNLGFTKSTVQNANNPIVIEDVFTVFADHVNKMSMYNSLAAPIADFTRVYNHRTRNEDGTLDEKSVKAVLGDVFGKKVDKYVDRFISDLQGSTKLHDEGFARLVNTTLANYKKATIGMNIRVALQQPTAIVRAFMLIDPKYFVNGNVNVAKNLRDMKDHCQIARWKSWGHSQVDMARDIDEIMMNREFTRFDYLSMGVYGSLDNVTWSVIWAAVRKEITVKNPNVEVDSEEFYNLCNERASEIYDKTQVVDSVMHRSHVMRNTDTMSKMLTSFMAEPTRTFNLMRGQLAKAKDAMHDGNKAEAGKIAGKAATIYLMNALACASFAAVADVLRGKDLDDDDEPEDWLANMLHNFIQNANPINLLPVAKEIPSIWQGWGTSNMALEGVEAFVKASQGFIEKLAGNNDDTWDVVFAELADGYGLMFGVPIKNIRRDVKAMAKAFGLEVFASSEAEAEKDDRNLLDKLFYRMDIEDGSGFDNFLNFVGLNRSDAERSERRINQKVKDLNRATRRMSGTDKDEYLWGEVMSGYTTDIAEGDVQSLIERRRILEEAGGDVEKFDKSVQSKVKTEFKKTVGNPDKAEIGEAMRNYLKTEYGYTDEKISFEILTKTDVAKQFQLALCQGDYSAAGNHLRDLIDAGLTYTDYQYLYNNRTSAIKATEYSSGEFASPVSGTITSTFGYRDAPTAGASTYHQGIDIAAPAGTKVNAADGGKVSSVGYSKTKGYYVKVSHGNGRYTEYLHLQGYYVQKGDAVEPNQVIGLVGSTGVSTGPHLHFSVIEGGNYVDPAGYLGL